MKHVFIYILLACVSCTHLYGLKFHIEFDRYKNQNPTTVTVSNNSEFLCRFLVPIQDKYVRESPSPWLPYGMENRDSSKCLQSHYRNNCVIDSETLDPNITCIGFKSATLEEGTDNQICIVCSSNQNRILYRIKFRDPPQSLQNLMQIISMLEKNLCNISQANFESYPILKQITLEQIEECLSNDPNLDKFLDMVRCANFISDNISPILTQHNLTCTYAIYDDFFYSRAIDIFNTFATQINFVEVNCDNREIIMRTGTMQYDITEEGEINSEKIQFLR